MDLRSWEVFLDDLVHLKHFNRMDFDWPDFCDCGFWFDRTVSSSRRASCGNAGS